MQGHLFGGFSPSDGHIRDELIDVGSEHTIEIYWDTGRNGVYDADCGPSCTGRATGTADGLAITLGTDRTDFDVRTACQVPSGFSETCAPRPSP